MPLERCHSDTRFLTRFARMCTRKGFCKLHEPMKRGLNVPSQSSSFIKGVISSVLLCALLSLLESLNPWSSDELHQHHHVRAASEVDLRGLSEAEKLELSQRTQVYCAIMVQPKAPSFWSAANKTWAKHCNMAVFYTSEPDKSLEAVDLHEKDEWLRVRKALIHAFGNARGMRWFFLARTTTFAIIENLKLLLLGKDSGQPFYLGHTVRSGQLEYVEYDSGVVLSHEALRQLVLAFLDPLRCPEQGPGLWKLSLEKELALCLKYGGVFAENGEDSRGKALFNSKSVDRLISDSRAENPESVVENCCSDWAITFTGMSPAQMQLMMYGVYRLRPYGHAYLDSLIFMPPEGSDND